MVRNLASRLPPSAKTLLLRANALAVRSWAGPLLTRYQVKAAAKGMSKVLTRNLEGGNKAVNVIYDCSASPPTIGDFALVLLLARHVSRFANRVRFVVVDGDYRSDWKDLDAEAFNSLQSVQTSLAGALLDQPNITFERCSWEAVESGIVNAPATVTIAEDLVRARRPIYCHAFNMLNFMLAGASGNYLGDFLLAKGELGPDGCVARPVGPYVALHTRHSTHWGCDRNLSPEIFCQIVKFLESFYPHLQVVVLSDAAGCDFFRQVAHENQLQVTFSRDISESFVGDAELALGSDIYLQCRGGGIGIIPIFSRTPYVIVDTASNEQRWSRARFCSWQLPRQRRVDHSTPDGDFRALARLCLSVAPPMAPSS